jgi:hypothetical protein
MASRRPEHGLTEADGRPAIAVLQREQHEPDQRNDVRRPPPGGWIDNLRPLRAQLSGVLAEFVA